MGEWKEYKLGEVCKSIADGDHMPPPKVERGIPFVTISNIKDNRLDLSDTFFVPQKYYDALDSKRKPQIGDTIYSVVGTFGKPVYIKDNNPFVFQRHIAILRPDASLLNPLFLYYTLLSPQFYRKADIMAIGAVQRTISLTSLRNATVQIPPLKVQKEIATALKSLDDKIEVNRQINENLEQQAQTLFKSWFVDFEPFKDGEFVESELGMIPKGWSLKAIGELQLLVTDYVANGSFASLKENVKLYQEEEYAVFIRNTDLKSGEFGVYVDKHSYDFLSKSRLYGGEIIISNVGDVGSVFLCPHLKKPMTLGNNIIMIKADDDITNTYLFLLFKWSYGQGLIQSITGGSAQPKFNKTDFKSLKIIMPSNNVLDNYGVKLMSMMNIIEANKGENIRLATLRDTLLPKLMSGELKVNDMQLSENQ